MDHSFRVTLHGRQHCHIVLRGSRKNNRCINEIIARRSLVKFSSQNRATIYLFKAKDRNTREKFEICSKLKIKIPAHLWCCSRVFIVNCESILNIFLVFLWLALSKYLLAKKLIFLWLSNWFQMNFLRHTIYIFCANMRQLRKLYKLNSVWFFFSIDKIRNFKPYLYTLKAINERSLKWIIATRFMFRKPLGQYIPVILRYCFFTRIEEFE